MGKIFEKLLVSNKILSTEELEQWKSLLIQQPEKKDLGEFLVQKKILETKTLHELCKAEEEAKKHLRLLKKQQRDKQVLEVVQQLGIVAQKEIATAIREKREAESEGENIFLSELFIKKGYLTPYLVQKFYKRGVQRIPLEEGIKTHEDLIINIPQYLRDRFFAKIAVKNRLVSSSDLKNCWAVLKKHWPRRSLSEIMLEKNILSEKKLRALLSVLKKSLPEKYPYLDAQIRDTQMARILVKRNFLSPWRLNKCLLGQLEKIKHHEYIPLRQMLVEKGYLSDYQFDVVLKEYGVLVSKNLQEILVPSEEIKIIKKEDIERAVHEAHSDVHLVLEEEDAVDFSFEEKESKKKNASDSMEWDELESIEDLDDIESNPIFSDNKRGSNLFQTGRSKAPGTIPLTESEKIRQIELEAEEISDDLFDIDVEKEEVDIELTEDNVKDFIVEDLANYDLEEKKEDDDDDDEDINMHEILEEVTMDASEECDAEELIVEDLQEMKKNKRNEKA
ncbi:MAG: hypothetical protein HUU50_11500 [Candidatus Brocadiae bacterium]|nr:hypothetical protein [Candidatus Brocadiia bacterium]